MFANRNIAIFRSSNGNVLISENNVDLDVELTRAGHIKNIHVLNRDPNDPHEYTPVESAIQAIIDNINRREAD